MIALHQRSRRRICQAAFCLLCALPTTGLVAWSAGLRTATHLTHCEQQLRERLGLAVKFQRVRYPQPGQSLYEGVELADAETGEWVLRCRALDVTKVGRKLAFAPSDVQVAAERADKLLRLLVRRLSHELVGDETLSLVPTQVTLESAGGSQTYDDVSGRLESQGDVSTATFRFRLPEPQPGEPPQFTIVRRVSAGGSDTSVKLDTMGAIVPITTFSPWLALDAMLGADASFRGSLTVTDSHEGISCDAAGMLANVDLKQLVSRHFPHHLAGTATIKIKQFRLRGGRVERATGTLRSNLGTIGGSLLLAAVEELGCQSGPASPGKPPFVVGGHRRYRDLALGFAVDQRGLQLQSLTDAERPGALILDTDGAVLLSASDEGPLPLVQLLRALSPDSELQVPATKETAQLAPWLPLPSIVRPADKAPPSPPLRVPD